MLEDATIATTASAPPAPAVVVAVPARLASSRLPGKVMADIGGKPMLRHVLERCRRARGVAAVFACSDSPEVLRSCGDWGFPALPTPESCSSGSERLAAVAAELVAAAGAPSRDTLVINVQGDQPLLDPGIIEAMAAEFARRRRPAVLTPVYRLSGGTIHDPNVVKVLLAADGRAITFSRSPLPHVRDLPPEQWHERAPYWGHVGLYGYRGDVLAGWGQLPASPLEELEKLEQLRLIEAGIPISTFSVSTDCLSVDTAEQLEQVRRLVATL
ncbi:MAG: 3-deoxy-manno-octulosonate cytidylyltransferase [Prochlorococcaceae cyanobacterium]